MNRFRQDSRSVSMTSNVFLISVRPQTPTLSVTPSDSSIESGTSVALKCATTSTYAPITYSFFKRTTGIEYDIISQSGDTYTMENISTDDSGYYKCSVTMNSKESYRSTGHTIEVVGEYMVKVESIVFNPIV